MMTRLLTFLLSVAIFAATVFAQEQTNRGNRNWRDRGERSDRGSRTGETSNRSSRSETQTTEGQSTTSGTASIDAAGFRDYRIIVQRNIFDPNRASRRQQEEIARQNSEAANSNEPVTEHVSLIGIWIPDDRPFALVSGNRIGSSQFGIGETFKGFRIVSIDTSKVVMEKDGEQLTWPTGQRIERKGEGEWQVAGPAEAQTRSAPGTGSSSSSGDGGSDDIVKRMRERRQKGG